MRDTERSYIMCMSVVGKHDNVKYAQYDGSTELIAMAWDILNIRLVVSSHSYLADGEADSAGSTDEMHALGCKWWFISGMAMALGIKLVNGLQGGLRKLEQHANTAGIKQIMDIIRMRADHEWLWGAISRLWGNAFRDWYYAQHIKITETSQCGICFSKIPKKDKAMESPIDGSIWDMEENLIRHIGSSRISKAPL